MEPKGISPTPFVANDDSVSNGSSPNQEKAGAEASSFSIEDLKKQRKKWIQHSDPPSFTHQVNHGEEGVKHHR
jgi:hypothetical protein